MTASSAVVLSNLAYLIGAVVLATIGGLIVWLFHRKPRSIYSDMKTFHRGLQALAPDARTGASGATPLAKPTGFRIQPEAIPTAVTEPSAQEVGADPVPPAPDHADSENADPAHADPAYVRPTAGLPLHTNGNGLHPAPWPVSGAGGLEDGLPSRPDGVVGLDPEDAGRPDGAVGRGPEGAGSSDGERGSEPEGADLPDGMIGPPPLKPQRREPAFSPAIDVAASESRVAGRAGVEAG